MQNNHENFEHPLTKASGARRLMQRVSSPAAFVEPSDEGIIDFRSLVRRHLPMTIALGALGLLIALAQLIFEMPLYRSQVLLEIQPVSKNLEGTMDPFSALHDVDAINLQTELTLLQNGPFKARVLARMATLPRVAPPPEVGLFAQLRSRLRPESTKGAGQDEALKAAAGSLDARIVNGTRLLELDCESSNPAITSSYLNTFAEEFVEDSIHERMDASEKTTAWLTSHMDETRAKLQDADARMRAFVMRSGNEFASSDTTVDDVKLKQLQSELAGAQATEIARRAAYETALKSRPDAIPELSTDAIAATIRGQLAELERQKAILLITLTPLNPKVTAIEDQERNLENSLKKEEGTLVARLQSEYESALDHERLLYSAYEAESDRVSSQSSKATEYTALKREVDGLQKMYDSLMQELNKTQVAQSAPVTPVSLVAPSAPPTTPYKPKPASTLMLGIMGGLAAAVAIAFIKEKLDHRLHSPESLQGLVRVPQLGVIPAAPSNWSIKKIGGLSLIGKGGAKAALFSATGDVDADGGRIVAHAAWTNGAVSFLADSFRATLASIHRQLGEEQNAKVIMVTSGTPGEGKTTVVSNLGIALSEAGRRVVVVDADFRRPSLSKVFGIESPVSLTRILEESRPIEDYPASSLAAQSNFPGLDVLPSTGSSTRIPTLIYSKRLPRILARLRREYDLVLIDVPPILFPADARVVAQLADAAVLIIRSGYTAKENVRSAVNILHEDGIPILGTVLNDWTPSGSANALSYYRYYAQLEMNRK
ncbi:MAG: polysaccharide biosynthesis tyrosine autokinase [Bryobacteraceae bacterium]